MEDRIVDELGGVYGPYTGRWFASTSDTDIEHMVARSEAHDSGLCAADLATRRSRRACQAACTFDAHGTPRAGRQPTEHGWGAFLGEEPDGA